MTTELVTDIDAQIRLLVRNSGLALTGGLLMAFAIAALVSPETGSIMSETRPTLVLYPVFVMFLITAGVLTRMGTLRIPAVRSGTVDISFYRTYDEGAEPEPLRVVTRHFINLLEVPVLFYVVVIITHITDQVTGWMVGLAWAFVALRCVHSYVHLTSNDVPLRLSAFAASGLVLLVMWGTLFVRLLLLDLAT